MSARNPTLGRSASSENVLDFFEKAVTRASPRRVKVDPVLFASRRPVAVSDEAANRVVHAGLGAQFVDVIAAATSAIDKATLLKTIGIDKATLRRRQKQRKPLDRAQTEAAVRTMEIIVAATETFGTVEKASEWLNKPHPLLDDERPIERASNQYGAAQVKSMLSAIRYGGVV